MTDSRHAQNRLREMLLRLSCCAGVAFLALLVLDSHLVKAASWHTLNQEELASNVLFSGYLLDPNVIFLLFVVAMVGIFMEISHPGVIVPGVVGTFALLLFFFSAGSLSPNWVGLVIMVLAFVLLILDAQLNTHGVLSLGTALLLIWGTSIFFDGVVSANGQELNPFVVYVASGAVGLIGLTLVTFVAWARLRRLKTGAEGMVGERVTALTPLLPEGRVSYYGENWAAILNPPATSADQGSTLEIVAVEGLRLRVQSLHSHSGGVILPASTAE